MADEKPIEENPEGGEETTPPRKRRKLMIGGFLLATIVGECALAAMFLPSESDVAPMDDITLVENQLNQTAETPIDPLLDVDASKLIEVSLAVVSATNFQPDSNTTLRIECELYAAIDPDDKSDFDSSLKKYQNRVQESILRIFRSAEATDFADSSLGLIKRSISEKVNETLGKPLVRGIIVTNFDFYEQ